MRLVYEATNAIEGHMLVHLLEQASIYARLDGEMLTGAVGELQAIAVVRVMVNADDYTDAKRIIDDWDATVPISPMADKAPPRLHPFLYFLIGLAVGLASLTFYYESPQHADGIDYDGNGSLDERWTQSRGRMLKTDIDRNRDGQFDYKLLFDARGLLKTASADDDFDGVFESAQRFNNGNTVSYFSDSNGDGFKEHRQFYQQGVLREIHFLDSNTQRPVKKQFYRLNKMFRAEVDSNRDGSLDTQISYDAYERVVKTSPLR